jgi:hypothetical protein
MPAYLLDKSVVRRTIEGLAQAYRNQLLRPDQAACLTLLCAGVQDRFTAYITPQSLHIMERLSARDYASLPELWQPTKALAELS